LDGTKPRTTTASLKNRKQATGASLKALGNQGAPARPLNPLTPSKLNQIAFDVRDGKADPNDVREALTLFYRHAQAKTPIPRRLVDFVAESFGRYLGYKDFFGADERTAASLDSAFGLVRKIGRPEADEQKQIEIAASVVRMRLGGISHQEAVGMVAETNNCAETVVKEAFRDHLPSALILVQTEHPAGFTPEEGRRLEKIIKAQSKI
jgi:hypothetical protein